MRLLQGDMIVTSHLLARCLFISSFLSRAPLTASYSGLFTTCLGLFQTLKDATSDTQSHAAPLSRTVR